MQWGHIKSCRAVSAIAGMCSRNKPKAATRILSADFFENFPFCAFCGFQISLSALFRFLGLSGPFCAHTSISSRSAFKTKFRPFLRVSGAFMGDAAHRTNQKKKPLSAPTAKETAIQECISLGRPVPPAPFLPCFLPSGQEKPFLCRSAVNVRPSFLSAVYVPFCPFARKRVFLRYPGSPSLESRPRSARSDREISQAMKSNLTRWEYIYYYLSYI